MDLKILREKYYYTWMDRYLTFRGTDGLNYSGRLEDWLEDGTLVMENITISAQSPQTGSTGIQIVDPDECFLHGRRTHPDVLTFVDSSFVRFIFAAYDPNTDDIAATDLPQFCHCS